MSQKVKVKFKCSWINRPYKNSVKVEHTVEGLENLVYYLDSVEDYPFPLTS